MSGRSPRSIVRRGLLTFGLGSMLICGALVEDMFVPAMIANWKVWPAVQVRIHSSYIFKTLTLTFCFR